MRICFGRWNEFCSLRKKVLDLRLYVLSYFPSFSDGEAVKVVELFNVESDRDLGNARNIKLSILKSTSSIISASVSNFRSSSFFFGFFSCVLSYYEPFFLGLCCWALSYSAYLLGRLRPICERKHLMASTSYLPLWKKLTAEEGSLFASFLPFMSLIKGKWTNFGGSAPSKW